MLTKTIYYTTLLLFFITVTSAFAEGSSIAEFIVTGSNKNFPAKKYFISEFNDEPLHLTIQCNDENYFFRSLGIYSTKAARISTFYFEKIEQCNLAKLYLNLSSTIKPVYMVLDFEMRKLLYVGFENPMNEGNKSPVQ